MSDCECMQSCPFFNDKMSNMPLMANTYKLRYCKGDNSLCARYSIFKTLGKEKVPLDLLPNQKSRVQDILSMCEKKACECLPSCAFFNDKMLQMPVTSEIYKNKYCKKDNSSCARYKVFKTLGKEQVPKDLFPNQMQKVNEIIERYQKSG